MPTIDPPSRLPVDHLSLSSLTLFAQCPERWRRRYLERVYEPPSGKMLLGSAAHAAESQHYGSMIDSGEGLTVEGVLDEFSDEFEDRIGREEVDWGKDKPGELKDSGVKVLSAYHTVVVPKVEPVNIERGFELSWGLDWKVIGFIDLEEANGTVSDLKIRGKRLSQNDADKDLQADMYLAARRAEGNPASGFDFHALVRAKEPFAEVISTTRTEARLDALTDRIFALAKEMAWRAENDVWSGAAPNTFFCNTCGYHDCKLRLG